MHPSEFKIIKQIGSGSFGDVYRVKKLSGRTSRGKIYAMKVLTKRRLKNKDRLRTILERQILTDLAHHNFVVNCHYAFQDKNDLYLILDYVSNGDLFGLLMYEFTEKQVSFVIAQLVLALTHLHRNNIIYRDLKPENILLDDVGYIKLTDFGLSKQLAPGQKLTDSFCGTVEYMAPEIIHKTGHGVTVDFWSTGILIYEMLFGKLPFRSLDGDRRKTMELILKDRLKMPSDISKPTQLMLRECLKRKPEKRIGYGIDGESELKNHQFFNYWDWNSLYKKEIKSPILNIINAAEKTQKISKDDSKKYKEFGINDQKRRNVNNAPVSEECQNTFQTFNFVPETPKEDKNDLGFVFNKLSNINLSDNKFLNKVTKLKEPVSSAAASGSNSKANKQATVTVDKESGIFDETQNSSLQDNLNHLPDNNSTEKHQLTTHQTQNETNKPNNNNKTAEQKGTSDRSSSPDSGNFHDNKIELASQTFDIKHRLSIQTYEKFCQHPNFLPVTAIHDFQEKNMDDATTNRYKIDVEFDESKANFSNFYTLAQKIGDLPIETALSEKKCQSIFKHLCLLMFYLHERKVVISNLNLNKIGYRSNASRVKFIKLLDLTCLEEISNNNIELLRQKYKNFLNLYDIFETLLFKNYNQYNRLITKEMRIFRQYMSDLREFVIKTMKSNEYSLYLNDTSKNNLVKLILCHQWINFGNFSDDEGVLIDKKNIVNGEVIVSNGGHNNNSNIPAQEFPKPPTCRLPPVPPHASINGNEDLASSSQFNLGQIDGSLLAKRRNANQVQ